MDYATLAPEGTINKTAAALKEHGFEPILLGSKEEALEKIKELIPAGASVMNGASVTLSQIGFVDYLKSGEHGWNNLHEKIIAETDPAKQGQLRREAVLSDWYLGSVHALAETGELVITSNSGSQLPHIVFTSPNVVFVVSTKKIAPTLEEARERVVEHVVPLEDERMLGAMGMHTALNKEFIFHAEPSYLGRKIYVLLVEEDLGF